MAFTEYMLEDEDVLAYLGIDYADDMVMRNITRMKAAAAQYLNGAIGYEGDQTDPRAQQVALAVIADMYDNREYVAATYSNKASASVRRLVADFTLQMVLDGRPKP